MRFGRGWEHADLASQAGDDHTEDPGSDPGERRAGLVGGRALRDQRADGVDCAAGAPPVRAPRRRRKRDSVQDRSHTPHRLQTTLTPAQEAVAVVLRQALLLPLDDLLSVVREFLNPHVSRSGLDPSPSGSDRVWMAPWQELCSVLWQLVGRGHVYGVSSAA